MLITHCLINNFREIDGDTEMALLFADLYVCHRCKTLPIVHRYVTFPFSFFSYSFESPFQLGQYFSMLCLILGSN